MTRPRLLDLFCGAGGCAAGYARAGFEVHGVDIKPQPRHLLSGASSFTQADALEYLAAHGREFDAIHASPPCQAYSTCAAMPGRSRGDYPDLLAATRESLIATGRPWVIENVVGAAMSHHVVLCGAMFGLSVYRHRRFETSFLLFAPEHPRHRQVVTAGTSAAWKRCRCCENYWCRVHDRHAHECPCPPIEDWDIDPYSRGGPRRTLATYGRLQPGGVITVAGHLFNTEDGREAMGIPWMTRAELSQAIPPAYTEFVGKQLLRHLEADLPLFD